MDPATVTLIILIVIILIMEIAMFSMTIWQTYYPSTSTPLTPTTTTPCPECRACSGLQTVETSSSKFMPINCDMGGPGEGGIETRFDAIATADLCAAKCEATPNCKGFSYNKNNQLCFVKTGTFPKPTIIYYEKTPK